MESFKKFLAGEPDDLPWAQEWFSMVREATSNGLRYERVRVVDTPLSDYNRWGLAVARHNIAAGEDIRYLVREGAQDAGLPHRDYWLFDSRKLVIMNYDEEDRFAGGDIIDDNSEIVQHNYWRDVAWHYALRRDSFATKEQPHRC
nr:DUF6879 family protein [Nocardia panacis]